MKKSPEICGSVVPHGDLEPILGCTGDVLGDLCKRCHRPARLIAECASCKVIHLCRVEKMERGRALWFTDEGCFKNWTAVKAKEKADREAAAVAKKAAAS